MPLRSVNKLHLKLQNVHLKVTNLLLIFCFNIKLSGVDNIRWLLTYFALTSVILLPNARVIIQDRTGGPSYTVQSIPLGLALLANLTTSVGTGFTELVESVFHTPNDLSYTQSGMLMGARMVTAGTRFEVSDSAFKQSLESFVKQCVFYDVLLHKYSLDTLRQQPNIWHFIS